jgi:hypothetical protein
MRTVLADLRARWAAWCDRRRPRTYRLSCTPQALVLEQRGEQTAIPWGSIAEITAFKRDCYTVDSIRLLIVTSDGQAYELAEDDEGWDEVTSELSTRLPGCLAFESWFFQVAFPAFETNLTRLYPPAA